jgi:hypothetical protein
MVEVGEHVAGLRPEAALFVRQGAPLELTAEIYWHLARALRDAARADPAAQGELARLNAAYRVVAAQGGTVTVAAPPANAGNGARAQTRRRGGSAPAPARSPWEVLQLDPSAPRDVIDVAYRYWLATARSDRAHEDAVAEIKEAYRALTGRPAEAPREAVYTTSAPADGKGGARKHPVVLERRLEPRVTRAVRDLALRLARRAGRSVSAQARRVGALLWVWAKERAADPFGEYQRMLEESQTLSSPEEVSELKERFAELAAREARPALAAPAENRPAGVAIGKPGSGCLVLESGPSEIAVAHVGREAVSMTAARDEAPICEGATGTQADARVAGWGGTFTIQVLVPDALVRLNGRTVLSAVLHEGDRIQVGTNVFRFTRRGEG